MIEAYVPRPTCPTENIGCEPVRDPGVGDMLHKIYAAAQDNTNAAHRIHEFIFGCGNATDSKTSEPRCMTEELSAIMDELQRTRLILLDINSRL